MGKITFARVDERLVHAQVMMTVAGSSKAGSIYVVNDETARDPFLTLIVENAASRTDLDVQVMTIEDAVSRWNEDQFGQDTVLLITKTIEDMGALIEAGIKLPFLDIGGRSPRDGMVQIINEVGITRDQAHYLAMLASTYHLDIFFQSTPSTNKVRLDEALRKCS